MSEHRFGACLHERRRFLAGMYHLFLLELEEFHWVA
jgi:hypothetical protein